MWISNGAHPPPSPLTSPRPSPLVEREEWSKCGEGDQSAQGQALHRPRRSLVSRFRSASARRPTTQSALDEDGGVASLFATRWHWFRLRGSARLDDGEFGSTQRGQQRQPRVTYGERFAGRNDGVFQIALLGNPKFPRVTDDAGALPVANCHQTLTGEAQGGMIDLDLHGQHL